MINIYDDKKVSKINSRVTAETIMGLVLGGNGSVCRARGNEQCSNHLIFTPRENNKEKNVLLNIKQCKLCCTIRSHFIS
jgi:hypothetical protein